MTLPPADIPLWLASRSPRRRRMLAEAGVDTRVRPAEIDDGQLRPGRVTPAQWVMALAYLKGRAVRDAMAGGPPAWLDDAGPPPPVIPEPDPPASAPPSGTVLAADTLCLLEGRILGQPAHRDEARVMLHALRDTTHVTMTGVCILSLRRRGRWMFVDRTRVHYGHVSDKQIESYLSSGCWQGKAGGYNLEERVAAGWPITWQGDPTTVMGLPMHRLEPWLHRFREGSR